MDNIFSGLEELGFKNLEEMDLYKQNEEASNAANTSQKNANNPLELLYDKTYPCPVCGNEVRSKTVRAGKARLLSKDTDLMPKYDIINPMFYDVVICPKCGYAALSKYFEKLKYEQTLLIKSTITPKFKPKVYPDIYDIDTVIERYKLALLNSVIKKSRTSEKAYTCLKLSWLHRLKKDMTNELVFMEQALVGFKEAFEKEPFPICGMDSFTIMYLFGELSRRLGKNEDALRWFGKVIVTPNVNPRLKELARDQKDLIRDMQK